MADLTFVLLTVALFGALSWAVARLDRGTR